MQLPTDSDFERPEHDLSTEAFMQEYEQEIKDTTYYFFLYAVGELNHKIQKPALNYIWQNSTDLESAINLTNQVWEIFQNKYPREVDVREVSDIIDLTNN